MEDIRKDLEGLTAEDIREGLDGFTLPAPDNMRKYMHITEPLGQVGLTCILYFQGGHLPEVQAKACACIREYVQILGKEARSCRPPGGPIVMAGEKGLPLMDVAQVRAWQEEGHLVARYRVSSHATREAYARQPPRCMLDLTLTLTEGPAIPLDKQISCIFASFAPSLFLVDEPPMPFVDLVLTWCRRLQPVSGTAGWGITRACDFIHSGVVRPFLAPWLLRFPGLNLPETFCTRLFVEHIADINWLTILNEELAARVGGPERLRSLGEDFPVAEYPGGYIIQAGPRPEIGDRDRGDIPHFYGTVQELLRPLYPPLEEEYPIGSVLPPDAGPDFNPQILGFEPEADKYVRDFLEHWRHRFDANWRGEYTWKCGR